MSFATWLLSVRQDRSRRYHKTTRRNTLLTAIRRMFFEPLEERVVLAVAFSGTTLPNDCGFWTCVATADFNSDGNPDVVFSQGTSTQVKVFSGNGNGGFPATTTFGFPTSLFPIANTVGQSVAAADFNGDGKADVAITDNRNGLDLVLGDGTGNFVAGSASRFVIPGVGDYLGRALAFDIDVADVNGDGKPDLVTSNVGPRKVSVFLNTTTTGAGTATFAPSVEFNVGSGAYELQLADLNGDGKPDIITANAKSNSVSVLLNTTATGATTALFPGRVDIAVGAYPEQVTVGDFDGDGKPDLATANANAGTVSVLRNTMATGAGTATFAPKVDTFTGGHNWAIANADFNGDGKLDLAVPGKMLLGNGNATFAPFTSTVGSYSRGFVVVDLNRDGKPDLAHSQGVLINGTTAVFPTLIAPTATSITGSSAILGGNVTSIGSAAITQRGILYSRTSVTPNPTLSGADVTQVNNGASTLGVFSDAVSGLLAGTSYSYVAFARNSLGTAYTAVSTFTTLSSTPSAVTTQPNNQTVDALSTVSFTAAASGSPAPTLQWVVSTDNGTTFNPVSGATFTTLSFVTSGNMTGNQYKAIFTNSAGSVTTNAATLTVDKLRATILVSGYNGVYDGASHAATGTATGLGGVDLSASLNLGASYTNVPGGNAHWVFIGGANYLNDEGNTAIVITKAPTTTNVTIAGAPFTYNGSAQTPATVTVTGAGGLSLTPTASYANNTNAGTATASYSYAESDNYLASSDSKDFAIAKASSTTVVTIAAGTFTYNGSAQTPATVSVTGVGGLSLTPTASYANNTNAGTATANYSYAESANYLASNDSKDFSIAKATATVVVTPYTMTYDGSSHIATVTSITGVNGESNAIVGTVDVSNTSHTAAGIYSSDSWSFTGAANYNNIASTTITDTINPAYVSGGFLAPISQNRAFKSGSTVPLKFQVKDGSGNVITTTSAVTAIKVQLLDGSGSPGNSTHLYQNGTSSHATGGTAFRYDSAGQQFMFNWNTKSFAIGSYKLTTALVDGTSFTQTIMLSASGNAAALVINGVAGQPAVGALLAGDVSLFIDNSNGAFSSDELARIQETVSGIQALVSPYGSNIVLVDASIGLNANIVLNSRATSVLGGMANGVLGVSTSAGEITLIDGWNWYAGANVNSIGSGQYDFQTVMTHEIGHSLGLGHSTVITSVMYPELSTAAARRTMLFADLETAGEGNYGSGLHAEAIFATTVTPAAPPIAAPASTASLSNSRADRVDGDNNERVRGYERSPLFAVAANTAAVDSAIAGLLMEITASENRWSSDLPTDSKPTSNDLLDALDESIVQEFGSM